MEGTLYILSILIAGLAFGMLLSGIEYIDRWIQYYFSPKQRWGCAFIVMAILLTAFTITAYQYNKSIQETQQENIIKE